MTSGGAKGNAFVVSAPSGTGKTTVCRKVVEHDPRIVFSASHTTRPRRPHEREGVDYHFVREEEFRRQVEDGAFLEYAEYNGRLYGTTWRALEEPLEKGLDVILEIEVQGARQVRDRRPESKRIFLLPPSFEALEQRLRGRGTDSAEVVEQRLAIAAQELRAARWFDTLVVNDRLEEAVDNVLEIVHTVREGRDVDLLPRFGLEPVSKRLDSSLVARIFA